MCLSENSYLERRARIIRSDKNGLVNTSFAFPIYDNNSITLNYRSDSDIKCEIDYHHPNWVSTEDDKTVVFSLFNQFIGGLDLQKNKIIWYLTDNNDSTLLAKGLDPKLKINAVDDPGAIVITSEAVAAIVMVKSVVTVVTTAPAVYEVAMAV